MVREPVARTSRGMIETVEFHYARAPRAVEVELPRLLAIALELALRTQGIATG